MNTAAVIPSCDLDKILAERDAIVRAAELVDAQLRAAPAGFPRLYLDARGCRADWNLDDVRDAADRSAWSDLIHGSGVWSFMDHEAREKWREHLDALNKVPPFTRISAISTVDSIHAQRGDMVKRGVRRCFERLSANYRTNRPDRFGDRMILTHVLSLWGTGENRSHSVNHRACDDLDDLTRTLCLLRGLPEPDHRTGAWHVLNNRDRSHLTSSWPRVVEFAFFTVKLHKNGNGHLHFTHDEDVLRLNKVLGMATGGLALADTERPRRKFG